MPYLEQWNVNTRVLGIEKDNAQRITNRMLEGLADSDMLITTGECLSATMSMVKGGAHTDRSGHFILESENEAGYGIYCRGISGQAHTGAFRQSVGGSRFPVHAGKTADSQDVRNEEDYQTKELKVKMADAFPKEKPVPQDDSRTLEIPGW